MSTLTVPHFLKQAHCRLENALRHWLRTYFLVTSAEDRLFVVAELPCVLQVQTAGDPLESIGCRDPDVVKHNGVEVFLATMFVHTRVSQNFAGTSQLLVFGEGEDVAHVEPNPSAEEFPVLLGVFMQFRSYYTDAWAAWDIMFVPVHGTLDFF